ncbi:MAG: outer membrane protein transport protein [Myxococcota bacterium]
MIVWLGSAALAGGFAVAQQGAVAGGTGHAGVARTGDPGLAWLAPAGLADDGGWRLAVGAAAAASTTEGRANDGSWSARSRTPVGTPPHAYASYARGPLVVGMAVHTPFAGGLRWPEDWALRTTAVSSAPTFLRMAPFVGRRFGTVSLAIGPHVDVGRLVVARRTDHVTEEGWVRVALAGAGVGVDASARWDVTEALAVGAAYSGRTAIRLSGWADFDVPTSVAATLPDQRATSRLVLPDRITLGVRVGDRFALLVDAEWVAWSVNQALVVDFASEDTPDTVQDNRWRNTVALRGGVEAQIGKCTLRAGGYVDGVPDAPVPRETLSPASPDGIRVAGTLGAGVQPISEVRVDGFAELLRVLARTSRAPGVEAAFRTRALVVGATVSVQLPGAG